MIYLRYKTALQVSNRSRKKVRKRRKGIMFFKEFSCNPLHPSVLIFNRIFKTGSTSLNSFMKETGKEYHFKIKLGNESFKIIPFVTWSCLQASGDEILDVHYILPQTSKGSFCNNTEIDTLISKRVSVENRAKLSQLETQNTSSAKLFIYNFRLREFRFVLYIARSVLAWSFVRVGKSREEIILLLHIVTFDRPVEMGHKDYWVSNWDARTIAWYEYIHKLFQFNWLAW